MPDEVLHSPNASAAVRSKVRPLGVGIGAGAGVGIGIGVGIDFRTSVSKFAVIVFLKLFEMSTSPVLLLLLLLLLPSETDDRGAVEIRGAGPVMGRIDLKESMMVPVLPPMLSLSLSPLDGEPCLSLPSPTIKILERWMPSPLRSSMTDPLMS